ncbi:MAG: ParB N-terminal domain-containing protein [Pleurocapsa sp. SU_196_0]|nr:ParB N-terminal domain-containing protein [Pleurocapsa sp. SU_196_0]
MNIVEQEYALEPLTKLRTHPKNANQGDQAALEDSVDANGFYGAVIAQRSTGYVVAGNHRLRLALERNATHLPVIWADIDDSTALRIVAVDNRVTRRGMDDPLALAELLEEITRETDSLAGTGYTDTDLQSLLDDLTRNANPTGLTDPEHIPERAPTRATLGSLWQLGPHRVMCGDSTNAEHVTTLLSGAKAALLHADPPYGMGKESEGVLTTTSELPSSTRSNSPGGTRGDHTSPTTPACTSGATPRTSGDSGTPQASTNSSRCSSATNSSGTKATPKA